ncbi:MAG: hypothetical protein NTW86_24095 [Candidatus Sumerlaeota bacterium]|nr:hypothetical protein [Candidatus Sumerlaeota bacterium]
MVRNGRVLGVGGRIALALLAGGLSSCVLIQKPYSSVRPLSAPPQTLGAILPQLEARWPEPRTFQGQGELIVSGEGIRGKDVVDGNLLYSAPDRLRFRASRLPVGTVFEILQTGGRVSIKLNREGKVFEGSAAELASHPELIGGVEPLEVVRAFLIGRSFLDAVKEEQARGADPGSLAFQGDALTVRAVREGTPTRAPRMEEYVVRRKDGLIQAARLFEPDGEGQRRRCSRWTRKGRRFGRWRSCSSRRHEFVVRPSGRTGFAPSYNLKVALRTHRRSKHEYGVPPSGGMNRIGCEIATEHAA